MIAQKKVQVMHDLMACGTEGGDGFREKYDLALTALALHPVTTLSIPPFMQWSRKKVDIRSMKDAGKFLACISSSALKLIGLGDDIYMEQESCLAERLSEVLKGKSESATEPMLAQLFDENLELDLEDGLNTWWQSVQIMRSCTSFSDLTEMTELLSEALGIIDASLPGKLKPGSVLGSTLSSSPRGRLLVHTSRQTLAQAQATQQSVEPFLLKADSFANAVHRCSPDILTAEMHFIQAADASLKTLLYAWQKDLGACLPEFTPTVEHGRILAGTAKWLQMVCEGWCKTLASIMLPNLDKAAFDQWLQGTSSNRAALSVAAAGILECRQLFASLQDLHLVVSLPSNTLRSERVSVPAKALHD